MTKSMVKVLGTRRKHFLNCGHDFTDVDNSRLITSYLLSTHSLFYVKYSSRKLLNKKKNMVCQTLPPSRLGF